MDNEQIKEVMEILNLSIEEKEEIINCLERGFVIHLLIGEYGYFGFEVS